LIGIIDSEEDKDSASDTSMAPKKKIAVLPAKKPSESEEDAGIATAKPTDELVMMTLKKKDDNPISLVL
jgi:hypothetical protein